MDRVSAALLVVLGLCIAAILLSWLYFRRYQITRPPLGVFNLADVTYMIVGIILVPFFYLALPRWLVSGLLVVGTLSVVYCMWEPVLRTRLAIWLASLLLVGADIWAALQVGNTPNTFFALNNLVLIIMVVGLTNLWAQSGMTARDAAILGAFLTVYDLTATWLLPLMSALLTRLVGLPFSPMVAWSVGQNTAWVGIGLGDLVLARSFPLCCAKPLDGLLA